MKKDPVKHWHCRYGHLSFTCLNILQKKYNDARFAISGYLIKSMPRLSHMKAIDKSIFTCSHMDNIIDSWIGACCIYEPISSKWNSGKRYMINFIDDFNRKVWVYFLVKKLETLMTFKNFKTKVEKEIGLVTKGLLTNREDEFMSLKFTIFLVRMVFEDNWQSWIWFVACFMDKKC